MKRDWYLDNGYAASTEHTTTMTVTDRDSTRLFHNGRKVRSLVMMAEKLSNVQCDGSLVWNVALVSNAASNNHRSGVMKTTKMTAIAR